MKALSRFAVAIAAGVLALAPTIASAQAWPTKSIRIINPFPAGGGTDTFARPLAAKLTQALGITHAHNGLALDKAPFELRARRFEPEIAIGVRIGITKAAEMPWRYGLKGSKFLSKPFRG